MELKKNMVALLVVFVIVSAVSAVQAQSVLDFFVTQPEEVVPVETGKIYLIQNREVLDRVFGEYILSPEYPEILTVTVLEDGKTIEVKTTSPVWAQSADEDLLSQLSVKEEKGKKVEIAEVTIAGEEEKAVEGLIITLTRPPETAIALSYSGKGIVSMAGELESVIDLPEIRTLQAMNRIATSAYDSSGSLIRGLSEDEKFLKNGNFHFPFGVEVESGGGIAFIPQRIIDVDVVWGTPQEWSEVIKWYKKIGKSNHTAAGLQSTLRKHDIFVNKHGNLMYPIRFRFDGTLPTGYKAEVPMAQPYPINLSDEVLLPKLYKFLARDTDGVPETPRHLKEALVDRGFSRLGALLVPLRIMVDPKERTWVASRIEIFSDEQGTESKDGSVLIAFLHDDLAITEYLPVIQEFTGGLQGVKDLVSFKKNLRIVGNGIFTDLYGNLKYPVGLKIWPRRKEYKFFAWTPESEYLLKRPMKGGYDVEVHSEFHLLKAVSWLRDDISFRGGLNAFEAEIMDRYSWVTLGGNTPAYPFTIRVTLPEDGDLGGYMILSPLTNLEEGITPLDLIFHEGEYSCTISRPIHLISVVNIINAYGAPMLKQPLTRRYIERVIARKCGKLGSGKPRLPVFFAMNPGEGVISFRPIYFVRNEDDLNSFISKMKWDEGKKTEFVSTLKEQGFRIPLKISFTPKGKSVVENIASTTDDRVIPRGRTIQGEEDFASFIEEAKWSEEEAIGFVNFLNENGFGPPFKVSFDEEGNPVVENLPSPDDKKGKKGNKRGRKRETR